MPEASGAALVGSTYSNEATPRQTLRSVGQVFDKLNRLTAETSAGVTHSYTYDKVNNRLTTTYGGSDRLLTSTYDKLNRLTTLAEGGTGVPPVSSTSYGYDLSGNTIRKTLPNGSTTLSAFDALNRRLSETTRATAIPSSALISSFDYSTATAGYPSAYDKVGNLLKIVEFYGRTDVKARTVTNTYDKAYRLATENLAEVSGANNTTTYIYDKANNRTSKVVTGTNPLTETSLYGQLTDGYNSNQLKTVSRSVGVSPTSFQYDANGNRSAKLINGITTQTYIFDPENRLTTLTDTTLGTFTYTYDHRTRRVARNEPNTTPTEISFSGGLSVQERPTGTATPTVETIRGSDYGGGIGGVLYTIRSGSSSYNAYNSRGDVVSKTDATGAITYQASYEAYGTRTQEQGATLDRQKANTKDEDPTGLLNEYKRYRDLEFGVFLTRDPMGFVDGPNVYTYVRQNPWTMFDPLGLLPMSASDAKLKHEQGAAEIEADYNSRGPILKFMSRLFNVHGRFHKMNDAAYKNSKVTGDYSVPEDQQLQHIAEQGTESVVKTIAIANSLGIAVEELTQSAVDPSSPPVPSQRDTVQQQPQQQQQQQGEAPDPKQDAMEDMRKEGLQFDPETGEYRGGDGTIYRVPPEDTPSNKPYIGKSDNNKGYSEG